MGPSKEFCTNEPDESCFTRAIVNSIDDGFAFVPFVGAGFSVSSGIPDTPAMYRYLQYCVLAVFGLVPERRRIPWAPRKEPWPTLASWKSEDLPTSGRINQIWQQALADFPKEWVLREAYGALADWRSTLRFISRIDAVVPAGEEGKIAHVHLGASDPSIVDSFFRALMEHRRPALTHKMLHSLSTVLRCDVLLTTNFDDLIERAFQDAGSPLSVYEVPSHDPLPSAGLVLRERTLIKLHGGKFWLRADDTLDESPSREDVRNFLGYLAGRPLQSNPQAVGDNLSKDDQKTALLICGLSANDIRIKHLLAYALAWMPRLRIFWLGHKASDVTSANQVAELACNYAKKRRELNETEFEPDKIRLRVQVHLCPNAGLFFLRLFQDRTHALPPSGAIFPSLWKLSVPPEFFAPPAYTADTPVTLNPTKDDNHPTDGHELTEQEDPERQEAKCATQFATHLKTLRTHIKGNFRSYSRGNLRATLTPVLLEVGYSRPSSTGAIQDFSGGLSIAALLHNEKDWGKPEDGECAAEFSDPVRAIWVDLVDVVQPAGFFLRLSLIIANSCGDHDPISRLDVEDYYGSSQDHLAFCKSIADSINRVTRESGAMWLVTVNAKGDPGCNSLFDHEPCTITNNDQATHEDSAAISEKNRWCDSKHAARFADTIAYLVDDRRLPIQFVFVTHESRLSLRSHRCVKSLWVMFGQIKNHSWKISSDLIALPSVDELVSRAIDRLRTSFRVSTKGSIGWKCVLQYLIAYTIAIFRIARYPVAIREVFSRLNTHLKDFGIEPPDNASLERFYSYELNVYKTSPRKKAEQEDGLGLVRLKQGDFLWMHLEERQKLLKQLHVLQSEVAQLEQVGPQLKPILAILTLRLHWYVSRWYGRLLLSSLDPMAVSQGVDHIFRGIEYAASNSAALFEEDEQTAKTAGSVLVAMVRHARHVLGVAEPLFGRRLSDQFANLALEALLNQGLKSVRNVIESNKTTFQRQAKSVFERVEAELRQVELQILRMYSTLQRRSGSFSAVFGGKGTTAVRELIAEARGQAAKRKVKHTEVQEAEFRAIELDLANCLICSRQYASAGQKLLEVLSRITRLQLSSLSLSGKAMSQKIQDWTVGLESTPPKEVFGAGICDDRDTTPSESSIGEVVQVLERLMYLEMHRSQSIYLARDSARRILASGEDLQPRTLTDFEEILRSELSSVLKDIEDRHPDKTHQQDPKQERRQLLENAREWGECGLALLRQLAISDSQKVYIDNVRLRSHSALCEALLAAHSDNADDIKSRMAKAKQLLSEAQAYLDEFPLKHAGKLRSVFELRCAEISILEASIALKPVDKRNKAGMTSSSPGTEHEQGACGDEYGNALAHIYDSLRAIKRAEVVLDEFRKSRWWWWILLVLKVKACEYLYRVRFARIVQAIRHHETANLGEKRNAAETDITELTRLLNPYALHFLRDELDTKIADVQMTDPMFLARIVHSFRMICRYDFEFEERLGGLWSMLNSSETALPGGRGGRPRVRLTHARTTLKSLTSKLQTIIAAVKRQSAPVAPGQSDKVKVDDDFEVDQDTLNYAEIVRTQAESDVEREIIWRT